MQSRCQHDRTPSRLDLDRLLESSSSTAEVSGGIELGTDSEESHRVKVGDSKLETFEDFGAMNTGYTERGHESNFDPEAHTRAINAALIRAGKKPPAELTAEEIEQAVLDICHLTPASRAAYFAPGREAFREDHADIFVCLANYLNRYVIKSEMTRTPAGGNQDMPNPRVASLRRELEKFGLGILCVKDWHGEYTCGRSGRHITYYRLVRAADVPGGADGMHLYAPIVINKERDDRAEAAMQRKRTETAPVVPIMPVNEAGQGMMFGTAVPTWRDPEEGAR